MYELLLPSSTKGLREQNICETKNCKIKVWELDLKNYDVDLKMLNEQNFITFIFLWTLIYFSIKSH